MVDGHARGNADGLVHTSVDGEGVIEVVDEAETRSLYFGTLAAQSAMSRREPDVLVLPYTRYMLSALLFGREPGRVLVLGMGGASLPRFFLHAFPDCQVDVVERRPKVVEVARTYFQLPSSPLLRIHVMDAARFVRGWRGRPFDLVLVDLHGRDGTAPVVHEPGFFSACAELLGRRGVLASNIWTSSVSDSETLVSAHRETFGEGHLTLPVRDRGNVILLGLPFPASSYARAALEARARELEGRLGVELSEFLGTLLRGHRRATPG
jgi:spermidine synthase